MLIITFHSVIIFPVVTVLIELGLGAGRGWRTLAGSTVRSLALNPIILALPAGIAYGQSGVALPLAAERFLALLADPAAPFALFALRASLPPFKSSVYLRPSLSFFSFSLFVSP